MSSYLASTFCLFKQLLNTNNQRHLFSPLVGQVLDLALDVRYDIGMSLPPGRGRQVLNHPHFTDVETEDRDKLNFFLLNIFKNMNHVY